jgi:hypothetical protein
MNKARILEEIRRTAAENGGVPLGSRRFEAETGIRTSEWEGKLWARWSDALREAGLGPNKMQEAYDSDKLLEVYARLALELGRLPSANDVRLKDRSDPKFPNNKVFERFGGKAELVQELVKYCRTRSGFDEVITWCESYAPRNKLAPDTAQEQETIGFVYLVKSGRFHKIGKSNAFGRREYELGLQLPERAKTIHVIRTDDPTGIEAYWHKRFEAKRKNGEWFELGAADVNAFKKRKSFM